MKERLILVSPTKPFYKASPWLGGWRLKAYVEANTNYEVKVYDTCVRNPLREHIHNVKAIGVGSLWPTRNNDVALGQALMLKYDVPLIFGGIGPHFAPEWYMERGADVIVRGEGEIPLVKWLNGNKECIIGPNWLSEAQWRVWTLRLSYEEIPWTEIWQYNRLWFGHTPAVRLVTVSVCKRKCIFCCSRNFIDRLKMLTTYELRSLIERVAKLCPEVIILQGDDELYGRAKRRFIQLADEGWMSPVPLIIQTNVECLKDERTVDALKSIRVVEVDLGVESFSDNILKEYRKNIREDDIIQAFELLLEKHIGVYANIILSSNNASAEDIKHTVQQIEYWKTRGIKFSINEHPIPYPGSDLMKVTDATVLNHLHSDY